MLYNGFSENVLKNFLNMVVDFMIISMYEVIIKTRQITCFVNYFSHSYKRLKQILVSFNNFQTK